MLNFYNLALASMKDNIISRMQIINNLSFNFIQTIDDKSEKGMCILEYPKKIYCEYDGPNKKILVSNGNSLVIKNKNSKGYYFYPLKKTPLEYLLNKEYLVSKIKMLKPRDIDNQYISFKISENNNEINIFFDKKSLNLVGWQTKDIYQNINVTYLSSIKINQQIDKNLFKLPTQN